MFDPPCCPNRRCPAHRQPRGRFFVRQGSYRPKCRSTPVPRFRCKVCRRGFSRQTFRVDYRDHKPHLNGRVVEFLVSGVGLRQTARCIRLSRRCTELKFRKLAAHARDLNARVRGQLPAGSVLQMDEFETYEGRRSTRPLTVPVIIERESRFIIGAQSAPIRPRGRMSPSRRKAIADEARKLGPRRDGSRRAILDVLRQAARMTVGSKRIELETDREPTYPSLAASAFSETRLVHRRISSQLPRTTSNPLFAINHTEAMLRDSLGRLRHRSWLVSKRGWCLDLHLQLYMAYKNYVRYRFNDEAESPAQRLGFVPRRLSIEEVLGWRQDWGSQCPDILTGRRVSPVA